MEDSDYIGLIGWMEEIITIQVVHRKSYFCVEL